MMNVCMYIRKSIDVFMAIFGYINWAVKIE
jgi:hypothetical protein